MRIETAKWGHGDQSPMTGYSDQNAWKFRLVPFDSAFPEKPPVIYSGELPTYDAVWVVLKLLGVLTTLDGIFVYEGRRVTVYYD